MLKVNFALSTNDFTSGRFAEVAEFIRVNWPYENRPSDNEALEILSKSLGYKGYVEAQANATDVPAHRFTSTYEVIRNFCELGLVPKEDREKKSLTGLDFIAEAFCGNLFRSKFVETWPLKRLGRWNIEAAPCEFDHDLLKSFEDTFERIFTEAAPRLNGSGSGRRKGAPTAVSVIAGLNPDLTAHELEARSIGELIDPDTAEALLLDAMPMLLSEILCVTDSQASELVHSTGMSMDDIWALPRNEAGFPSLYAHMRTRLKPILDRKAIDLFLHPREGNGFYPFGGDENSGTRVVEKNVEEGRFSFFLDRDEIESEVFRTYTWGGELKGSCGRLIAQVAGTYIAGPARRDTSAFDLISALDEMGGNDVEIIDSVLEVLSQEIFEEDGEEIAKGDLNARLLFESGNIVTIWHWERHAESERGAGAVLLAYCIDELKRKFKRDMHIAAIIKPYQYRNESGLLASLREQRMLDIKKISKAIIDVAHRGNVVQVILSTRKGEEMTSADATFSEYCLEQYLGQEAS